MFLLHIVVNAEEMCTVKKYKECDFNMNKLQTILNTKKTFPAKTPFSKFINRS